MAFTLRMRQESESAWSWPNILPARIYAATNLWQNVTVLFLIKMEMSETVAKFQEIYIAVDYSWCRIWKDRNDSNKLFEPIQRQRLFNLHLSVQWKLREGILWSQNWTCKMDTSYFMPDMSNEQALTTDINREYMATHVRRKAVGNKAATSNYRIK